jgi:hypothetical protein
MAPLPAEGASKLTRIAHAVLSHPPVRGPHYRPTAVHQHPFPTTFQLQGSHSLFLDYVSLGPVLCCSSGQPTLAHPSVPSRSTMVCRYETRYGGVYALDTKIGAIRLRWPIPQRERRFTGVPFELLFPWLTGCVRYVWEFVASVLQSPAPPSRSGWEKSLKQLLVLPIASKRAGEGTSYGGRSSE